MRTVYLHLLIFFSISLLHPTPPSSSPPSPSPKFPLCSPDPCRQRFMLTAEWCLAGRSVTNKKLSCTCLHTVPILSIESVLSRWYACANEKLAQIPQHSTVQCTCIYPMCHQCCCVQRVGYHAVWIASALVKSGFIDMWLVDKNKGDNYVVIWFWLVTSLGVPHVMVPNLAFKELLKMTKQVCWVPGVLYYFAFVYFLCGFFLCACKGNVSADRNAFNWNENHMWGWKSSKNLFKTKIKLWLILLVCLSAAFNFLFFCFQYKLCGYINICIKSIWCSVNNIRKCSHINSHYFLLHIY